MENSSDLNLVVREGMWNASVIVQNADIEPTNDQRLRQAVLHALEPGAANAAVYFGMWKVSDGGLHPPSVWAYQPLPGRPNYDPAKAKQLLDAAGYADGIDISALGYDEPTLIQQTEIYIEQLKAVGINWNLDIKDGGVTTNEFFVGRERPIYTTSWPGGGPADFWIRGIWGEGGFYSPSANPNPDPRVQQLLDKAVATADQEERKELYHEFNQIVHEQAWWVSQIYGGEITGINKKVQNPEQLYFGSGSAQWRFEDMWLA